MYWWDASHLCGVKCIFHADPHDQFALSGRRVETRRLCNPRYEYHRATAAQSVQVQATVVFFDMVRMGRARAYLLVFATVLAVLTSHRLAVAKSYGYYSRKGVLDRREGLLKKGMAYNDGRDEAVQQQGKVVFPGVATKRASPVLAAKEAFYSVETLQFVEVDKRDSSLARKGGSSSGGSSNTAAASKKSAAADKKASEKTAKSDSAAAKKSADADKKASDKTAKADKKSSDKTAKADKKSSDKSAKADKKASDKSAKADKKASDASAKADKKASGASAKASKSSDKASKSSDKASKSSNKASKSSNKGSGISLGVDPSLPSPLSTVQLPTIHSKVARTDPVAQYHRSDYDRDSIYYIPPSVRNRWRVHRPSRMAVGMPLAQVGSTQVQKEKIAAWEKGDPPLNEDAMPADFFPNPIDPPAYKTVSMKEEDNLSFD